MTATNTVKYGILTETIEYYDREADDRGHKGRYLNAEELKARMAAGNPVSRRSQMPSRFVDNLEDAKCLLRARELGQGNDYYSDPLGFDTTQSTYVTTSKIVKIEEVA